MFIKKFTDVQDACELAHAIVDTAREPIVVLDQELRVIVASRRSIDILKVSPEGTERKLLDNWATVNGIFQSFVGSWENQSWSTARWRTMKLSMSFSPIGHRTMCLNARQVFYKKGADSTILLGIDIM